jgi:hypothetical protein
MMQRPASLGARVVLAIGLLLHALFLASLPTGFLNGLFVEASQGHGQASDLFGIYQAGANLIHGYSIYDSADYRHEAPQAVPYFYFYRYLPPTAYVAGLAAALLAPWTTYWLWVILNELMMGALAWAVLRDRRWPAARRQVVAGLWLGCFPFYIEQFMGQFSFTMAVLLYLLWRWDIAGTTAASGAGLTAVAPGSAEPTQHLGSRAREWLVTVAWTASVTLKTYTLMLAVAYLRDRLWRRIVAGAALGIAVCAPYFVLRPADAREFLRLNLTPFMAIYKGAFGLQTALRPRLASTGCGNRMVALGGRARGDRGTARASGSVGRRRAAGAVGLVALVTRTAAPDARHRALDHGLLPRLQERLGIPLCDDAARHHLALLRLRVARGAGAGDLAVPADALRGRPASGRRARGCGSRQLAGLVPGAALPRQGAARRAHVRLVDATRLETRHPDRRRSQIAERGIHAGAGHR